VVAFVVANTARQSGLADVYVAILAGVAMGAAYLLFAKLR
jgi:hypothetical protein